MAHIDRYIDVLTSQNDATLSFVTGEKVMLVVGGASHPLSPTEASAGQLTALFKPILPADKVADFDGGGAIDFNYASPHGLVQVAIRRTGGGMSAVLRSLGSAGTAKPAAPAVHVKADIPLRGTMAEMPASRVVTTIPGATQRTATMAAVAPRVAPGAAAVASALNGLASGAVGGTTGLSLHSMFLAMVEAGASDLHLGVGVAPMIRKDGDILPLGAQWPACSEALEAQLKEIMPAAARARFEADHDVDFAYELSGRGRFRMNVFRDRNGVVSVCRFIPSQIRTVEDLRLPQAVVDLCALPKGLVVVTGPSGSGKSTTLAAMVDCMNRTRADRILTIEDPIEFVHPTKRCLINQREVHTHTRSFQSALRAALREDPSVVLLGGVRDRETMEMALEIAETGHLVLTSLHTSTATAHAAIERMMEMFPADQRTAIQNRVSETLKGVVAQTLCQKPPGGRVAALEILVVNGSVANLIREGKTFQIPALMQTSKTTGCVLLNDSLMELVKARVVNPEEAMDKSAARKELAGALTRAGFPGPWTTEEA